MENMKHQIETLGSGQGVHRDDVYIGIIALYLVVRILCASDCYALGAMSDFQGSGLREYEGIIQAGWSRETFAKQGTLRIVHLRLNSKLGHLIFIREEY